MALVGIKRVAEHLGVSTAKVRLLVREHGLPAIDLGHRTQRFDLAMVDEWVKARAGSPAQRGPSRVPARRPL
jgi:excisionase family DNA binding protein